MADVGDQNTSAPQYNARVVEMLGPLWAGLEAGAINGPQTIQPGLEHLENAKDEEEAAQ